MTVKDPKGKNAPVARRLRDLRVALEIENSAAMAARLGVSPQRLNNVETGSPLGIELARTIVRTFPGVTLDWLYLGDERGLSVGLSDRLRAAAERLRPAGKAGKAASR